MLVVPASGYDMGSYLLLFASGSDGIVCPCKNLAHAGNIARL